MTEGNGLHFDLRTNAVDVPRRMRISRERLAEIPDDRMRSHADAVLDVFLTEPHPLAQLAAGDRDDPTVSAQRKIGFAPRGLVRGYVSDPRCGDCGVLLVLPAGHDVPWPA